MTRLIEHEYRGARLQVALSDDLLGELRINGLVRDSGKGQQLVLTSTVQTDYEWHEFVEARIIFGDADAAVTLLANKTILTEQKIPLTGGSH